MSEHLINQILVIDDSEDFRNLLNNFFEKVFPGASIDTYDPADGKPSDAFDWEKYNLIILDYDLGNGENGLEWLRIYNTSSSFPPTIMLTAQNNEEVVVNAFRYGAHDFLRKDGLTKGRIIESINRALIKYQEDTKKADTQQLRVHIYNKEKFYRSLEQVKSKDMIILVEIDKFQNLRDENGMLSTDKIVNFTSEKLLKYITHSKHVGAVTRISDSSIGIYIHSYRGDDRGRIICENICTIFDNEKYKESNKIIGFSLSIASVFISDKTSEAEAILKQVDIACRAAREKSGNSFEIYEISNNDELKVDEKLDAQIDNVFSENRVMPYYQAFVKLSEMDSALDSVDFYQVRINLIGLDAVAIEGREFIPLLKNRKQQKDMDRWIINSCIQKISLNNSTESERVGFFVILTEESLADISFLKWLESALAEAGLSNLENSLVLEISIDSLTQYQKQASFLIKTLREKYKILFALTGITRDSTLESCLSQSNYNFIMLSPFSDDSSMNEKEVNDIVVLAKKYSCLTVANKIESNEDMMKVMGYEFDFISGYFLQPPQENIIETEVVTV
jgi:EAL domain-containing protein (putative c-di-GMP-specific phosphodiesterase class I)/FixJ family two-component response regulator